LVVAHPDDDAYGFAGTVALNAVDPDFRFVLVHATDGGARNIRDGFPATRETLGAIRRGECQAAWRAHGRVPDRHEWLGYPDGEVDRVPFSELVDRIANIVAEEEPDVVATFGTDGITAHPDHIAVGAATDVAFARFAVADRSGFKGHPGDSHRRTAEHLPRALLPTAEPGPSGDDRPRRTDGYLTAR
jgi:LmbE family N-acetylglucosaminyl deacetylase